jgi:hypothetical protein
VAQKYRNFEFEEEAEDFLGNFLPFSSHFLFSRKIKTS